MKDGEGIADRRYCRGLCERQSVVRDVGWGPNLWDLNVKSR